MAPRRHCAACSAIERRSSQAGGRSADIRRDRATNGPLPVAEQHEEHSPPIDMDRPILIAVIMPRRTSDPLASADQARVAPTRFVDSPRNSSKVVSNWRAWPSLCLQNGSASAQRRRCQRAPSGEGSACRYRHCGITTLRAEVANCSSSKEMSPWRRGGGKREIDVGRKRRPTGFATKIIADETS
jgi:hypothetical protein